MGKRYKKNNKTNKILKLFIIFIVIIILYNLVNLEQKEANIKTKSETVQKTAYEQNIEEGYNTVQKTKQIIPEEYEGYKVSAFLEIPDINLQTFVLEDISGLDICVSKFWGSEANEIGNFCIAGHNYQKPNMFNNVYKLEIGDYVYLTDNKNGKLTYQIYDIYKVKPQDTESLSQKTNGKREITLITCTANAKNRIIVKAVQI